MNIVSSILLAKRSDSECTGDKYECQKPTDSTNTRTIVLAVVIPVVVVIIIFSCITLHIYRRNQREKLDDYDPEFVGGLDYYERKYYEPHMMTDQQQQPHEQDPNRENYYKEANTAESISDLHNTNAGNGFQNGNVNYNEMHDININGDSATHYPKNINTPSYSTNVYSNNINNNNI
ncbi:hypothetical protein ACO0QE_004060 [Hanseniaspora vineae]